MGRFSFKRMYRRFWDDISRVELMAFVWNLWVSIFVVVDYYNVFNTLEENIGQYVVSILASFLATVQFLYVMKKASLYLYRITLYISMSLWVYITIYELFETKFYSLLIGALLVISWINLFALEQVNDKFNKGTSDDD